MTNQLIIYNHPLNQIMKWEKTESPYRLRSSMKREKILLIAGRLFWQKGYLAASTDDIARAAKINKATIYYYFKNKATILFELALGTLESLIDLAMPICKSDMTPEKKLESFVTNHVSFQLNNLGLSGLGQRERRNLPARMLLTTTTMRDKYEEMFQEILEEGINQGKFECTDTKVTSRFILGFLNSMVLWYKPTGRLSPMKLASEAHLFISRALSHRKGPISL